MFFTYLDVFFYQLHDTTKKGIQLRKKKKNINDLKMFFKEMTLKKILSP